MAFKSRGGAPAQRSECAAIVIGICALDVCYIFRSSLRGTISPALQKKKEKGDAAEWGRHPFEGNGKERNMDLHSLC
jgi:hypothetical protein